MSYGRDRSTVIAEEATTDASDFTVHVAAIHGLPPFELSLTPSGSTAAGLGLVYESPSIHLEAINVEGRELILRRFPDSVHTTERLADALRFPSLVSTRLVGEDTILATFDNAKDANHAFRSNTMGLATGAYRLEAASREEVSLVAREPGDGPQRIVIHALDEEAQWRRFVGGEMDVLPEIGNVDISKIGELPKITIRKVRDERRNLSLFMNMRAPSLRSRSQRRTIACAIDRGAVAVSFGLQRSDAAQSTQACRAPRVRTEPPPDTFRLLYLVGESFHRTVAANLHDQWTERGFAVELVPLEIETLVEQTLQERDFELALLPVTESERKYAFFSKAAMIPEVNLSGFESEEYEKAFLENDQTAMRQILNREIPYLPLVPERTGIALRPGLCLDPSVPLWGYSWAWIGQLRRCQEMD